MKLVKTEAALRLAEAAAEHTAMLNNPPPPAVDNEVDVAALALAAPLVQVGPTNEVGEGQHPQSAGFLAAELQPVQGLEAGSESQQMPAVPPAASADGIQNLCPKPSPDAVSPERTEKELHNQDPQAPQQAQEVQDGQSSQHSQLESQGTATELLPAPSTTQVPDESLKRKGEGSADTKPSAVAKAKAATSKPTDSSIAAKRKSASAAETTEKKRKQG